MMDLCSIITICQRNKTFAIKKSFVLLKRQSKGVGGQTGRGREGGRSLLAHSATARPGLTSSQAPGGGGDLLGAQQQTAGPEAGKGMWVSPKASPPVPQIFYYQYKTTN